MENKFKAGDTVYALEDRDIKLLVKRYVDRIYYCEELDPSGTALRAFFERELTSEALPKK